ncbi:MAG TPA: CoA pyrophosphatase [Acidocella sp.]|jgi:8-oxo-dGTP pyrophosphatase MutT (NUDIX family)|uniref:CoA pyrophosphatase n=1 Tax=Acidocella sp. TaxID=50710 RepID=UPI002CACF9F2|nr:CoA pyrophosphatase [Acidocella sp.]HVE21647.1 CoA pyrophosphatase [Acidocella sp.]
MMDEAALRRLLPPGLAHNALAAAANRPAAVLVALEPERGVWLTRRSARMSAHAGQVSFPGGKIETGDVSVEAAALREAAEEIGLDPMRAQILGRMDEFITGTGFHISPVVALVPRNVHFTPDPREVQEVFCLPFAELLDPASPQQRHAVRRGADYQFWVWPHEEHVIWGATARILLNLALRLRGAA